MPTYQYACTTESCGNAFELVQTFTEPSASACPVCGGPVRKVYSAVGVVFKGSGFYRTDSRAASASSESATKSESAKSDSAGKSESAGKSGDSTSSSNGSSPDKGASASPAPAASGASSSSKAAAPA